MLKNGDLIWVSYGGKRLEGWVILVASENQDSLMIGFDGMLAEHLGVMPILRHDDGVYRSVFDQVVVDIKPRRDISEKLKRDIRKFLAEDDTRRWVKDEFMEVYLRKSFRAFEKVTLSTSVMTNLNCLDIPNLEVRELYQGQGLFTSLIGYLVEVSPFKYLNLENTHNPILKDWATRHGWTPYHIDCFYRHRV